MANVENLYGNFKYKVSVIVPVYNVSEYLATCLESLLAQTIDRDAMEILLINDGSTDNSFEICKQYAEKYSVFKLFSKENEGLSATRNFGIDRAQGRYLMYLDSDDTFSPETVKSVTDFFDAHYDEVDLVTFLDQPYSNGKKLSVHYRYKYLKKSGVYDLNAQPYISQTRVNVCVKNMEENFYFDTTPGFRHEDQEYCSKVLLDKQKIGYCAQGEYQYNRSNEGSIVSNYFHAFYIFESTIAYFERLFAQFEDEVPRYYQSMYFNDLQWKHNDNILYPYHYSEDEFARAMDRIKALLARVDADIIYKHPMLDNFNKYYWLRMKPNAHPVVIPEEAEYGIYVNGQRLLHWDRLEVIMLKIRVSKDDLKFMGFLKSAIYTCRQEPAEIYVVENGEYADAKKLDVYDSVFSFYHSLTKTCNFYGFTYHCDITKVQSFSFFVRLDGYDYRTRFWCMPTAVFSKAVPSYIRGSALLTLDENIVRVEKLTKEQIDVYERGSVVTDDYDAASLRKKSVAYRKKHRVWLYYDLQTVEKDNGYDQFMNDIRHDDGVDRYYVYNRELSEIEHLFTRKQKDKLVRFGSKQHKLLYLSAEKIFTAFYGFTPVSPFGNENEEAKYLDLFQAEIYYLQHGVLHANLRVKNHAERCRADKIVISTKFEKRILMEHYAYEEEDLVCTGMARYDSIDPAKEPKKRILFAPSWREYLTNVLTGSSWELRKDKLSSSSYYTKFMEFLSSPALSALLAEHDLYLDVKLHPIIRDAKDLFVIDDPRICMASDTVAVEDYRVFITDISSFVYDFVYMKRAVLYFMPDMEEFRSGMNHYREMEVPLEEGYGPLTLEAEDAVRELSRIVENGCRPAPEYKERMEDVFFTDVYQDGQCAEGLYRYAMQQNQ